MVPQILGVIALIWYVAVILVIAIGTTQLFRYFLRPTAKPTSPELPIDCVPHVTVIRPVAGLEPCLYECLEATFKQTYPRSKLTVYFCISSRNDPALQILERLIADYKDFDAKVYIEEDNVRAAGHGSVQSDLGPNPKIRNMSKAYNEAKGDIVWIIDCNVWVSQSVCGLMVDQLCGFGSLSRGRKYKFVHQLPLAVDITSMSASPESSSPVTGFIGRTMAYAGGLLDEMFLSSSHAKFYTAISTVAIAPCTVGKSNMFRRSHLAALTQPSAENPTARPGIDYFSYNICEDHLIGDLLWKAPMSASIHERAALEGLAPEQTPTAPPGTATQSWGHHALIPAPPCIQPLANVSLQSYAARRARWLRVRKFTVPAATLVEPGTESLLATLMGAYGLTSVSWVHETFAVPQTWTAFWMIWVGGMVAWGVLDYRLWCLLQRWRSEGAGSSEIEAEDPAPVFVGSGIRRPFREWFLSWLGREMLAWPVWAWAVLGGVEVIWRGKRFWVGYDTKVHAIEGSNDKDGKGV